MSTHAHIAIELEDGYNYIYCHNDGYPEHLLKILRNHYNSKQLALQLISLGDASFIDKKLEPTTKDHSFDQPEDSVSIFYHRDRKESWECCQPKNATMEKLKASQCYVYLFENDQWQLLQ